MNKNILSQYLELKSEIEDLRTRIILTEETVKLMEEKGYTVTDSVTCGKRGRKPIRTVKITGFPVPEYHKQKGLLEKRKEKLIFEETKLLEMLNDVEEYISGIENARIRRILRYRYIDGYSWIKTARKIGENVTADSIRMECSRFLEKL